MRQSRHEQCWDMDQTGRNNEMKEISDISLSEKLQRKTGGSYKPGSVPCKCRAVIIHLWMPVARHLLQPTRKPRTGRPQTLPYLVLPRMGFTWPAVSPRQPVGSYPTFSPLPARRISISQAVCFLWHFPWGHPRSALRTILPCVARTFLCWGCPAAITHCLLELL